MPAEQPTRLPSIDVAYSRLLKQMNPEKRALLAIEVLKRTEELKRLLYAARDSAIVEMHMMEGQSYYAIGLRLDMSKEAVHKVVRAAVGPRKTGRPRKNHTPTHEQQVNKLKSLVKSR